MVQLDLHTLLRDLPVAVAGLFHHHGVVALGKHDGLLGYVITFRDASIGGLVGDRDLPGRVGRGDLHGPERQHTLLSTPDLDQKYRTAAIIRRLQLHGVGTSG